MSADVYRELRELRERLERLESAERPLSTSDSWTPGITGSGSAGSFTIGTAVGRYVRMGTLVTVRWRVTVTAVVSAPTGDFRITGLPFTVANQANGFWFGQMYGENYDIGTNSKFITVRASPNATYLDFIETVDNGTATVTQGGVVVANLSVFGSITYETDV